jgi:LacI family transcriptional regulator
METNREPLSRATIRDVSRVAEVSIKTVSRVLNNEKYVSPETRARVEQVMAELSFQPSSAARALAGHRSHQIALICDNPSPWYVYQVQYGTRVRCQRDRVRMIAQPYDRGSPRLLEDIVNLVDQTHPDGLVLTPPACDDLRVLEELLRRRVAVVRIQPGLRVEMTSAVSIDNQRAAYEMTCHLLGLGHRRIGFIVGDRDYAVSEQRLSGYELALAEAGVPLDAGLIHPGYFDFASGVAAAELLLALTHPPTAIFASNDDMAAGVLATAHHRGVTVPRALSVAGFDDTGFASIVWPALTTIRQPLRALAEAAVDLLLTPGPESERRQIPYELIVRGSTGPVAGHEAARI